MINIAILGFGVVGSGVYEVLKTNADSISEKLCGESVNIKYILDKRSFPGHELCDRVTTDFDAILADEEVVMVVETMGGSHPAYDFTKKALCAGKNVVTSNKEVVANFGAELLALARENNVNYLFEASVGGGIPIIRPMWQCLAANKIEEVTGILNGTTNYILTKMITENAGFAEALADAQKLGYAEADPTADVEGLDTKRKICILASLAFGRAVPPERVHAEGITAITASDVALAKKLGYAIKLLGKTAILPDGRVYAITCPSLVDMTTPMAFINDVYNAVCVRGNAVEDVLFCGRGAGKLPTASAVVADILDIARECRKAITWVIAEEDFLCDYKDYPVRYFVRTADRALAEKSGNYAEDGGEYAFLTDKAPERELDALLGNKSVLSKIRLL